MVDTKVARNVSKLPLNEQNLTKAWALPRFLLPYFQSIEYDFSIIFDGSH